MSLCPPKKRCTASCSYNHDFPRCCWCSREAAPPADDTAAITLRRTGHHATVLKLSEEHEMLSKLPSNDFLQLTYA